MGKVGGRKQAISLTLDDKVCTFFKGKNRSKEINRILTAYLRWSLGERDQNYGFTEEKTVSQRLAQAFKLMGDEKDEFTSKVMIALIDDWREVK